MASFKYTAKDPSTGKETKSTIQANSESEAVTMLKRDGLVPVSISEGMAIANLGFLDGITHRVNTKDKVLFVRQLSTLINAGLPLTQSLRNVESQTSSKSLKSIIGNVITDVEGGRPLSSALAKYPKVFSQVVISLVSAGESSGTLDRALERIALQLEKDADVASKIRGAMIYPIIVMCVMVGVISFMLIKVLPQVNILYQAFPGANLPIETRILLGLSHLLIKLWWVAILLIIIIVVAATRWIKTPSGRKTFDFLKLRTPPFSKLFEKVYMARFSRTSSTLVGAGVPLLQVLNITAEAVSNKLVSESIMRASTKVKAGKSLSESLEGDPNFLPLVPSMIHIGEASGAMEQMLAKVADYYEKQVDDEIKNISALIEPVMMVILGVVAMIIVAAVLLPVYGLAASGAVSGGGV